MSEIDTVKNLKGVIDSYEILVATLLETIENE